MATKTKAEILTTPEGVAVYPHLHAPDTKFDDGGVYKTDVRFVGKAAKAMKKMLAGLMAESREKFVEGEGKADSAHQPWEQAQDEDGNDVDGIIVSFKMKASGIAKKTGKPWSRQPALYDAAGGPIKPGLKVGGGTRLKVAFEPYLYHGFGSYGVSLRLQAVQVLELQSWKERDAGSFGFDAQDGGFTADEADPGYFAGGQLDADADARSADAGSPQDDDGDFEEADF